MNDMCAWYRRTLISRIIVFYILTRDSKNARFVRTQLNLVIFQAPSLLSFFFFFSPRSLFSPKQVFGEEVIAAKAGFGGVNTPCSSLPSPFSHRTHLQTASLAKPPFPVSGDLLKAALFFPSRARAALPPCLPLRLSQHHPRLLYPGVCPIAG